MTRATSATSDPSSDARAAHVSSVDDLTDTSSRPDRPTKLGSSSLLQSRVGRDKQRYDGDTRLLVCIVVVGLRCPRESGEAESRADTCLLISSSKDPTQWILPKGGWETDESVVQSALREANEEAGVAGHLVGSLGTLDFVSRQGTRCRFYGVTLQATQVFDDWAEPTRLRKWVSFAAARELLQHRPELVEMVTRAAATTTMPRVGNTLDV
ncbi:unnamed protein product [Hyaloperonospora brassicae]|uniref:Nudix hydrolase domain-containing protein n=1 Tax=Hyaloperonospora brassicae TaxID=162125 RepID=A0AAV0UCU6_HYABA|nr:unnamed protein product [Hyaloperonospora brassicae]